MGCMNPIRNLYYCAKGLGQTERAGSETGTPGRPEGDGRQLRHDHTKGGADPSRLSGVQAT